MKNRIRNILREAFFALSEQRRSVTNFVWAKDVVEKI
jgi:hypothetical protein